MAYPTTIPVRLFKQGEFAVINGKKYVPERTCRVKNLGGMPDSIPILLCDSCGAFNYAKADGSTWNYCQNCGAKVVGG